MRVHLLTLSAAIALAVPALAQTPAVPPWQGQNLQVFPADIARNDLMQRMREFSFALGVRCQHCHTGGNGVSFDGVDFASDAKPAKVTARVMLRMTQQINGSLLPALPARAEPRVGVACVTCHRGLPLPKTLQTTLYEVTVRDGVAAAVARYRELRATEPTSGRYDFGEWEINELARRLVDAGRRADAIAILEMNGEFHPRSTAIDLEVGRLHAANGDRDKALARYQSALAKEPDNDVIKQRIAALERP